MFVLEVVHVYSTNREKENEAARCDRPRRKHTHLEGVSTVTR